MQDSIVDVGAPTGGQRGQRVGVRISDKARFVDAAAAAMGIDTLRVINTGRDHDGTNTLALAPGVVVAYERNSRTNVQLEDAGSRY